MKKFYCIWFFSLLIAIPLLSGNLQAQNIWELANKTHRSKQIIPAGGKTLFSVSNHLFFSSDLGNTWIVDDGSFSNAVNGFAIGTTGSYYFSSPQGFFSSPAYTDMNNENWSRIDTTGLPKITSLFVRAITDPAALDEIFIGTASGLWHTTTAKITWTKIHDAQDGAPILQICAFGQNIYYRSLNSVFASHDNGGSWSEIATSVANATKTAIIATSDNDFFLAVNANTNTGSSTILHSTDGGTSFFGFRGTTVGPRTIQTLIANDQGDLFLGGGVRDNINPDSITHGYVWRCLQGSFTWDDFTAGLPSGSPPSEVIGMGFGAGGNVFAGTDSAGLWRSLLPSAVRQTVSQSGIILSQNSPNPANSFTEFSVSSDHNIKASLSVFDALGRNVIQLSDGDITPGTHFFRIETASLPNGAYFYRLQTPEIIESNSFVVRK